MKPACQGKGNHDVENVRMLDVDEDKDIIDAGYKFVGICKHCNRRIIAKDDADYRMFD
jgi:hypothetical protein